MRNAATCLVFCLVGLICGYWLRVVLSPPAQCGAIAQISPKNGDVNGDGEIDQSDAIYILEWRFIGGPAPVPTLCPPTRLPATGQTFCYTEFPGPADCDVVGPRGPGGNFLGGQDGHYSMGCPIGDRYIDPGDGTITDTCTGLMWQKDAGNNFSTWYGALEYCDKLILTKNHAWASDADLEGGVITTDDVQYSDWRLPNIRELQSIVNYGQSNPAIDSSKFTTTQSYYWSSSTAVGEPSRVWMVNFTNGSVITDPDKTTFGYYIRAVRTAQ